MRKLSTKKPYIELKIKKNYKTFNHFYQANKDSIYRNIVDVFKGLTKTKKKELNLLVSAKIQKEEFQTDFVFDKEEHNILIKDVLPYFERMEEYEICGEIMEICKKLGVVTIINQRS